MKKLFFSALTAVLLAGCSTTTVRENNNSSETVMVTYHVKSGKEAELQTLLSRVWQVYQTEHLVFAKPHIIVRGLEKTGDKTRFVEILTWVNRDTPEHAPDAVQSLWDQEQSLCEARNGQDGIEIAPVEFLIPSRAQP
jgi:hypothetical protein